ncbi:hypothetical protein Patl1_14476 [Pistacia atlantica]|uniref:Uncharacterized protein n=1 Tax=Pistacia atlantica TaxID=434234 RepID=A0ACC1AUN0_9ROSI|nr:hypothetical protein Patl1_14476 [Pistacia atlantica]
MILMMESDAQVVDLNAVMTVFAGFNALAVQRLVTVQKLAQTDHSAKRRRPKLSRKFYVMISLKDCLPFQTEFCGWGVEAAEPISKGEFIIEYIGEVIDDALCEQRLWDMKYRGVKNFYMCEIRKDFTIDATFKGNASRFLNHGCDPNCILEKWQVEGETRVGVFAARSIKVGEPLTYDYRFIQFGPEVKCHCGAPSCQGYLGTKRKVSKLNLCWGSKRKRTSAACLAIIAL